VTVRVLRGDCRDVLPTLPDASVQCCVTSPPYWNLRDYQTGTWDGGDAACDHKPASKFRSGSTTLEQGEDYAAMAYGVYRDVCGKCGAKRIDRQIGLEATPEAWLATMVQVFREVKRVLRPDGVCWVNCGDSYQDKQLQMMPARLAIALQADGWWLRNMLPWIKRSAMPESVNDRPASAVEYVFMFSKSSRYHYDNEAVRRAHQDQNVVNGKYTKNALSADDYEARKWTDRSDGFARPPMTMRDREYNPAGRNFRNSDLFYDSLKAPHGLITNGDGEPIALDVNPAPMKRAHFATFPPKLITPLIRASTSERGCCAECGAPWVRQTEKRDTGRKQKMPDGMATYAGDHGSIHRDGREAGAPGQPVMASVTTGWTPGCDHDAAVVPCVVLDIFGGSGTVGLVCDRLQRDALLIDLNGDYAAMSVERVTEDLPMFADVQVEDAIAQLEMFEAPP
jgi:DNA modification methylase